MSNNGAETMFHDESRATVTEEIVHFEEDASVTVNHDVKSVSPIEEYLFNVEDSTVNDIKGFLSRPVEIYRFDWLTTQTEGHDLILSNSAHTAGITLPNDWFAQPMISEKLKGFTFIRCDIIVRVQVNAQPFNAGRLILWFDPLTDNYKINKQISNISHFGGITGYSHVDLDLSESTAVELRIPYIGTVSHFNLITGNGGLGNARAMVYSPLRGGADCDGTVWIYAENIDVQMPTGMRAHIFNSKLNPPYPTYSVTAQVKSERKKAAKGTVETLANTVSTVASAVGKIPGLAEVGNAVSWAADAAAGVASFFGWSKPTDPSFPELNTLTYARHMANYDGDSKAKSLALDARNEVAIPNFLYCSDEDQMSLAYLFKKQIYMDRFQMNGTQTQGQVIWSWPVDPSSCVKTTVNNRLVWNNTMMSYLSVLFTFWRGTINYHFKIVKTCFHSGRIRLFYAPGADANTDPATIDRSKCYSTIYDIRDMIKFDFSIPYVSPALWLRMNYYIERADTSISYNFPTGMLYIEVLNKLVTSTSDNTIEFLVETSGGDDLQYAFLGDKRTVKPDPYQIVPTTSDSPSLFSRTSSPASYDSCGRGFRVSAQSGDLFPTKRMTDYNANVMGMGEAVSSLRQCLKRYGKYVDTMPPVVDNNHYNLISPYVVSNSTRYIIDNSANKFDGLLSYCSYIYRFMSGSMRLMFSPMVQSNELPGVLQNTTIGVQPYIINDSASDDNYWKSVPVTGFTASNAAAPLVTHYPLLEGNLEVDVPFYQNYPAILTSLGSPLTVEMAAGTFVGTTPTNYGSRVYIQNSIDLNVYRQIGEDFSFGYSVGPPTSSTTI
nr:MAG: structural polyprotein [Pseudoscorpian dicistrovirus]